MQTSVPEALQPRHRDRRATQDLYGLDDPATRDFGMQMLATRRLVERGVRFIQVQHGAGGAGAWDAHSGLKANHEKNFKAVDKPIAGLLKDLKQRGLLDSTIVLFASEFGRTPGSQGSDGRDHHIYGFSRLDGRRRHQGGHRPRRDRRDRLPRRRESALRHRHPRHDPQQLGLDSRRLEIPGRKRLDIDHGKPITEILA